MVSSPDVKLHHALLNLPYRIQRALLPSNLALSGGEIGLIVEPAEDVAGDYADFIVQEGHEWIVIADVAGKGLAAGLVMIMTHAYIHGILQGAGATESPAAILKKINPDLSQYISRISSNRLFVTITLIKKNKNWDFTYSGLHLDFMVYRAAGQHVEMMRSSGSWLGMAEMTNDFDNRYFSMDRGDILFLMTDGFCEPDDKGRQTPSVPEITDIFRNHSGLGANELIGRLRDLMVVKPGRDDVSLIVLKRT